MITRFFTNDTVNLQYGPTKIRHNIHRIKTYKSKTNIEDINPENMYDDVRIRLPVIYLRITLKLVNKVYNCMSTEAFKLNHLGRASEVFHDRVIFFTTGCALIRIGDEFKKRVQTILT